MLPSTNQFLLKPVDPKKDCPAFLQDDHTAALAALAQMNARPQGYYYKTGSLNVRSADLLALALKAETAHAKCNPLAFFLEHFSFFDIIMPDQRLGFLTGFYEPLVDASSVRSAVFPTPIYPRPPDLVSVKPGDDVRNLPDRCRFARYGNDGALIPYFTRRDIEQGAIDDRVQPIAFVRDQITAFFIHIQGAACLTMDDGSRRRITYAAKSGHDFTGIGGLLVKSGAIASADISMQSIKAWLYEHPDYADAMMWNNQSYIFFRQTPVLPHHPGPIAAAKVPLSPERSIAVDRLIHTFATPFFIQSDEVNGAPFAQTMIAQDTGSAIIGAARADLYFGTGDAAGEKAGGVKAKGRFTIMIPHQSVAGLTAPIVD